MSTTVEIPELNIDVDPQVIVDFCRRWKLSEFGFFGSVLRDDFGPESDVDVLFMQKPEAHLTLFDMVEMKTELEQLFGRPVDLGTRDSVESDPNWIRRRSIMGGYRVFYAE